ncbi:LpqB family beta-propeller domain-containing protein [Aeromicrobium fastidiosum]|uniref:GerMN domain-containing protein n=1 Tax=Aeromicrobium fastidiosum TaxID=52699 RepID=UPI0020233A2D|nr:LpqB family beta-propeller domain-containing protein [Aeromicrobium fastidiosum]MCL8251778.1 LpqB family beta-propeller domain-containing protein [Aeromicrobium fastidiosum]
MTRRSVAGAVAAVVVAAVMAGCAGIPSSGPVVKVADDGDLGQSAVRYAPARPQQGATPEQVVRGYLDAMLAFPSSSRTASAFLTPEAARGWAPTSQVRVYSQSAVSATPQSSARNDPDEQVAGRATVRLGFIEEAQLDRQGRYTGVGRPRSMSYSLEQVDGEWRITDPQDGLLVTQKFFTDYFRSFDLYFFDRPGRRLVPDPVYLVVGDQLATSLVSSLAGGPASSAREAMRTYVPSRTVLRPSVPVSSRGVADVEFTDDFAELSGSARDRLSAQVVWTLRQVPGIEAVQVVGGTTALSAGGDEAQPIQAWGGFGPSTARGRAYAVVDDRIVEVADGQIEPISGSWGRDARGVEQVAVAESGVAGVLPGGDAVRLTTRQGTRPRTIRGNDLIAPDWDPDGKLWLVDRSGGTTRVRIVDGSADERALDVRGVAGLAVDDLTISPDGTRYAVTATGAGGGELYVGCVLRDVTDQVMGLGDPVRVPTTVTSPRSASWSSTTELSFLGDSQAGTQVYQVAIDGSATTSEVSRSGSLLPDVGAATLAIGQGRSVFLYVTDRDGALWYLAPGGSWRVLDTPPVTALATGR